MIIIDSNVLIFSEGADAPERFAAIAKIKDAIRAGRVGTNVIIASEVFYRLQKLLGSTEAELRVSRIVSDPGMDYLEFNPGSTVRAMKLSRDLGIRINDALIAQQAIEAGASVLTDNLKDFRKIKAIKTIPLRASA